MFTALKNCLFIKIFNLKDRAARSEFWYFVLFIALVLFCEKIVFYVLTYIFVKSQGQIFDTNTFILIYYVFKTIWGVLLVALVTVTIRRLHDLDKSGLLALFYIIPVLGAIIVGIIVIPRGTIGTNKFGPDPLDDTRHLQDSNTDLRA